MDLDEDNEQNRKDFNNKNNTALFAAEQFTFNYCKDLCASLTRIQEHMLENRCCEYCNQTFAGLKS